MATPRRETVITPEPPPNPETLFSPMIADEAAPEEMALENIIADLGGEGADASIHVYRIVPGKSNAFVGQFSPLDFSLEHLQINYGAGEYKIHVRQNGRLRANKTIAIAVPRSGAQNVQLSRPDTRDDMRQVIETMQSGFSGMATMMQQTIQAMIANQPKPKTTLETLQELQLMKGVFGDSAPRQDPMQVIELASSLAEKIQPRTGEVGNGEILLEAIKSFGPMLAAGAAQQQAAQTPPQFALPQPAHAALPQNQPPESEEIMFAKMYLNMLIKHAENEHDPELYAEVVLDTVGTDKALDFLGRPDWLDSLAGLNPRVKEPTIAVWLNSLRSQIILLTSETEPGNDPAETVPEPFNATEPVKTP